MRTQSKAPSELETIKRTQSSFGWEWKKWTQLPDFESDFLGWANKPPEFFRGKIGVDAGCGSGRFAVKAALCTGDEGLVVAVDNSNAVEVAKAKTHGLSVAVVRADLRYLPFRHRSLDFLYSIGVIQHLEHPENLSPEFAKYVKEGGYMLGTVYSSGPWFMSVFSKLIAIPRLLSLRIGHPSVVVMSIALAIPSYLLLRTGLFWRFSKYALEKRAVLPRDESFSNPSFDLLVHKWFDNLATPIVKMYTPGEIQRWFLDAGVKIESDETSMKLGIVRGTVQ